MWLTYQDATDSAIRYLGAGPSQVVLDDIRQSIEFAYREIYGAHNWSYYYKHGRIWTNRPYSDGLVDFDPQSHVATLSGGVFPAWAADGYVRIGTAVHRVDQRIDDTHISLIPPLAPMVTLTASPYMLYQDTYLLPAELVSCDQAMYENAFGGLAYSHPREWLFAERYIYQSGMPQAFTITGDQKYPGRLVMRIFPVPTDGRTLDFVYKRKPSDLAIQAYGDGSVSVTGIAIQGTGTNWNQSIAGKSIRFSSTSRAAGSRWASNQAIFESTIVAVQSPVSLTIADTSPYTLSGVSYLISDIIDIEQQSMTAAFLAAINMYLSRSRKEKTKDDAAQIYYEELNRARERDSRSFAKRFVGDSWVHRQRAKDMPLDLFPTYR
jgi:hypothetical protein